MRAVMPVEDFVARAAAAEHAGDAEAMHAIATAAAASHPDYPVVWYLLGTAQHRLGRPEAVASLKTARALAPDQALILNTLGLVAFAHRDLVTAMDALLALAAAPSDLAASALTEAYALLAKMLCEAGKPQEGERHARAALALDGDNNNARVALAACLLTGRPAADPADEVVQLLALASAREGQRKLEDAYRLYGQVLQRDPGHAVASARHLDLALTLCDWQRYDALISSTLDRVQHGITGGQRLDLDVFNLLALPVDPPLILAASRAQAARYPAAAAAAPRAADGRRLRIAYLLPYTDRHSLPQALDGVIAQHDRDRFEVLGYSLRICDGSPFSQAFRSRFDQVRDLKRDQAAAAAETIRGDAIDLLIDTTGHTGINGLEVLSHRPAPVQAHYLGYGLTSGADYVDYLITDRNFLGPGGERWISEAPVFLPHSFMATMRAPIDPALVDRAAEGLPERGVVFANFNHPCKLDPHTFALWLGILRAVPGSVLWLGDWAEGARKRLRGFAAEQGVSPRRLVFAAIAPHPRHLARLALADIALDNRLHGGGVTTVDALWAGLPVVSLAGQAPPSRLGASLLGAVGISELVTDSEDAYVDLAVALAGDPARRQALRERLIAARDQAPLFDTAGHTRLLETAYQLMWRDRCAGLRRAIEVSTADRP